MKEENQYFGNLEKKLSMCKEYVNVVNNFLSKNNEPLIDKEEKMSGIVNAHKKFYGEDNKYTGSGILKEGM